jgi:hypothetical protein
VLLWHGQRSRHFDNGSPWFLVSVVEEGCRKFRGGHGVSNLDLGCDRNRSLPWRSWNTAVLLVVGNARGARMMARADVGESAWQDTLQSRTQVWQASDNDSRAHLGERPKQVRTYGIGPIAVE